MASATRFTPFGISDILKTQGHEASPIIVGHGKHAEGSFTSTPRGLNELNHQETQPECGDDWKTKKLKHASNNTQGKLIKWKIFCHITGIIWLELLSQGAINSNSFKVLMN